MSDNLFIDNLKQSTGMRVFIFLVILLVSSLVGAAISAAFMFASDLGMKIAQGLSSIMMFVVPPIVYYFITRKEHAMPALGFRAVNKPWLLYILIGAALMFVSLPVTNQLTSWNEAMNFGSAFERLVEYLKTLEDAAQAATEKMLKADNIGGLLFNLLIIALIPAVGEELTFRGVLQQGLSRRMNPHVAIILSQTDNTILFTVQDTGAGIPTDYRDLMFTPFTKVNDLSEGLGLGLPLSMRHILNLGGKLYLDDSYQEGCRIIIEMPK